MRLHVRIALLFALVIAVPAGAQGDVRGRSVLRHAGNAHSPYGSPTDFAGAASVGESADVGRRRMTDASLRAGLTWLIHPSR